MLVRLFLLWWLTAPATISGNTILLLSLRFGIKIPSVWFSLVLSGVQVANLAQNYLQPFFAELWLNHINSVSVVRVCGSNHPWNANNVSRVFSMLICAMGEGRWPTSGNQRLWHPTTKATQCFSPSISIPSVSWEMQANIYWSALNMNL